MLADLAAKDRPQVQLSVGWLGWLHWYMHQTETSPLVIQSAVSKDFAYILVMLDGSILHTRPGPSRCTTGIACVLDIVNSGVQYYRIRVFSFFYFF